MIDHLRKRGLLLLASSALVANTAPAMAQTAAPPVQLTANYYTTYRLLGRDMSMLTSFSYKN